MIEREEIVAAIVAAAGGELTGRVRLQKTAYLLERLGFGMRLPFEYHYYGPYSRELDHATTDAKAFGLVAEEFEHRQSDGAMFSIFRLMSDGRINSEVFENMPLEHVSNLVHRFAAVNVTVLELAATVDWLWNSEKVSDWSDEIVRRKGKKVQNGRLERAVELLRELNLPPPASATRAEAI